MECYPTCARVSGMNFCTVFSTVLSIFTPSVVFLVSQLRFVGSPLLEVKITLGLPLSTHSKFLQPSTNKADKVKEVAWVP